MAKRVALFINSLYGGGAERVVSRISRELAKKYELYIFLIDGRERFYDCSGEIVDLGCQSDSYSLNALYAFLRLNGEIKKYQVDCVISFLDVPNIINCVMNKNALKIISIRCYIDRVLCQTLNRKVKYYLSRRYFKKADRVITVSNELNTEIIDAFQIDESRTIVIENPYDIDEIQRLADEKIADEINEFISEHKTAVAVGRLDQQKGYEDLINIFSEVQKKDKDAALIILGEGPQRKDLEALICEKKLENKVLLLGLCKNPFAIMSKCKLYVSTSLFEGFPNTLVEAMACGIPVIHTDCKTGPREIITDICDLTKVKNAIYAPYGILIPSYTRKEVDSNTTKKEFAEAWSSILSMEDMRKEYKKIVKERASCFSMERCIKKYQQVIEE